MLNLVLGAREPEAMEQRSAQRQPRDISPLSQWRKVFPNIPALAENIALQGLINPLVVAVFTRAECERYIQAVNLLWGTSHAIEELPVSMLDGQPRYHVLIAGERRLRACRRLWDFGCDACRKRLGDEDPGMCFHRHLPDGIKVDERIGMTPFAALSLQYAENNYEPPNYDEQATGYKLYFELLRVLTPALTVAEFARVVGRNPTTIGRMLRYCELPESVRVLVRDGEMHFSLALLFDRYAELVHDEAELAYWVRVATEERLNVKTLRDRMKKSLEDKHSMQRGLFGNNDLASLQQQHRRQTLDNTIAVFLGRLDGFLSLALRRYGNGELGKQQSPFAQGSVARAVLRIYQLLTILVPHVSAAMTAKQREEMRRARTYLGPRIQRLRRKLTANE
ncbi:MAG: hypothetical protein NUV56_02680 [Candidatus Uhrbacteria bacterium]|nr:hypothetical protein [Candidatus Uhrbacteria bacterium]